MSLNPETRAAEKEAQIARLAAKGSPEYLEVYASQPAQIRIAAEQGAQRKSERAAKNAADGAAVGNAAVAAAGFGNISMKGDK